MDDNVSNIELTLVCCLHDKEPHTFPSNVCQRSYQPQIGEETRTAIFPTSSINRKRKGKLLKRRERNRRKQKQVNMHDCCISHLHYNRKGDRTDGTITH